MSKFFWYSLEAFQSRLQNGRIPHTLDPVTLQNGNGCRVILPTLEAHIEYVLRVIRLLSEFCLEILDQLQYSSISHIIWHVRHPRLVLQESRFAVEKHCSEFSL